MDVVHDLLDPELYTHFAKDGRPRASRTVIVHMYDDGTPRTETEWAAAAVRVIVKETGLAEQLEVDKRKWVRELRGAFRRGLLYGVLGAVGAWLFLLPALARIANLAELVVEALREVIYR